MEKCVKVAELLEEHETKSTIRKRIFEQFVRPVILCSYVQFNNMLNEPNPQKQIEELERDIQAIKKRSEAITQKEQSNDWGYDIDLPIE